MRHQPFRVPTVREKVREAMIFKVREKSGNFIFGQKNRGMLFLIKIVKANFNDSRIKAIKLVERAVVREFSSNTTYARIFWLFRSGKQHLVSESQ